jgi:hypothetical protein
MTGFSGSHEFADDGQVFFVHFRDEREETAGSRSATTQVLQPYE